ncbi:MAG: hypothetical protein K2Z81_14630 [Cyanobacteria bacterium]|nr:hypothetical protein [Cyanobacteriota bacterium]
MNSRTLKKQLKYIVPEIRLALIREPGGQSVPIGCPDDLEQFVAPLKILSEEHFVAYHLDCRNHVANVHVVSHGTASASLVHPREVFKAAVLSNAHAIIVAHNHPAGSMTPSNEDIETTEMLIKAGDILGVKVIDHVIVSSNGIRSLRETHGYLWA